MTAPTPFSTLVVPCDGGHRYHCCGADPLTREEAQAVQREDGFPPERYPLRDFESIRTTGWWVTQWTCGNGK